MSLSLRRVLSTFAAACALAGCSSGTAVLNRQPVVVVSSSPTAVPTVKPTVAPTPTPTPTSASGSATVTLNGGAALVNAPLSTALPAPAGYAQSLSIPLANAAAGTKVAIVAGPALPAGLVPLARPRRAYGAPRADASGSTTPIFYDSITPAANITVAGAIASTQTYPSGTLIAGETYYLAYYDPTQPAPAWQTIAGPVTATGGTSLAFAGTISPVSLVAGKTYGFATFSLTTPTATPPPAPATLLYFGNDSGLTVANEAGAVAKSLAIPSQAFDLDDAGNVYAFDFNHGGSSPGTGGSPLLAKFASGTATQIATYTPTIADRIFVAASGAGEVAALHSIAAPGTVSADVWDPGVTGKPSRTIVTTVGDVNTYAFAMTHDGTLYLPDRTGAGVPEFDVIKPGTSVAATTIPETIVPPAQQAKFTPNYAAVGADGTLYVTEYSFEQPDPLAGTYIYPLGGPERFIPAAANGQGGGPQGVDVDALGNIYVINNNTGVTASETCQSDTLHSMTEYAPSGALIRTVTAGFTGYPLTVAADGTTFVSSFAVQLLNTCSFEGTYGIYSILPGATTATEIATSGSTQIVLYDGTHKTNPFSHATHGSISNARGRTIIRR